MVPSPLSLLNQVLEYDVVASFSFGACAVQSWKALENHRIFHEILQLTDVCCDNNCEDV